MTKQQLEDKTKYLTETIKALLPEFYSACLSQKGEGIIIHQDAFSADYQQREYLILGMAIKFAGLQGKEIRIHGKNRETL